MPSYSGKRTYEMTTKKWGGRNQRRDERRSSLQNRIGVGARPMVSPWENGVAPGMQSSVLGQGSFSQSFSSSYLLSSGVNRGSFGAAAYGGGLGDYSNKIRHLNRMGAFDDQRGRGLLPNPTPLLGVAPQAFPPSRGSDFLQQRMGGPWDSSGFHTGGSRAMSSAYYPSNRGRQDNSRRFLKAKRPQNKSSNSSSSSYKGSGPKEGRGKAKGANSSNKSLSKGGDDKDKDSSSNTKSGKQGESPLKRERSDKDENDKEKDDTDVEEEKTEDGTKVKKEGTEEEEKDTEKEDKKKDDKEKQEDIFPVKALYCHICELDSFSSKKGYIRHLQGITHAKMAEVYHAKNAATLELLNISAKLAEMRQRDKVLRRTGKKGQPVMKTTEQILVQKWLKVGSCCGQKYKSPFGLEEHKLSIHHLRAKYQSKHKDGEEEKTEEADAEGADSSTKEKEDQFSEDSHDEVLRYSAMIENAQKEAKENPITMNSLPVYSPSIMIGLEYISKELRFRCRVCKGQGFKSLENHCQSHTHFDNIASYLTKEEDKRREEKRKQEEAEAAAKRKEEKEAAKAKAKEEKLAQEKKDEEEEKMEEDDEGGLPSDYITLDDCAKDKSDDEEMDEDVIPLGEEEERILNAKDDEDEDIEKEILEEEEEEETNAAPNASQEEEEEEETEEAIFEEIGEKIDFDGDLKNQLKKGSKEAEEESQAPEEVEVEEPPQKRSAYTPRRRGRARSRARNSK